MMLHEKNFEQNFGLMHNFFVSNDKLKALKMRNKNLHEGLYSLLKLIKLHGNPKHINIVLKEYKPIFDDLVRLKSHNNMIAAEKVTGGSFFDELIRLKSRNNMIAAEAAKKVTGGSFFGRIGHFFKHVGHAIAHGAKTAAHAVAHGVKTAAHAVAHVAKEGFEDVKHGFEKFGHLVEDAAVDSVDYIKKHAEQLGKLAEPFLEKFINLAIAEIPAVGPIISQGAQIAEQKVLNPYVNKKLSQVE